MASLKASPETIIVSLLVFSLQLIPELLKQPLQTQISLSTDELDDFNLQEGVHILLSLRDFKVSSYLSKH